MKPIHYLTIIFFVMLGVLNASDANAQSLTYTTTETSLMSSVATNSDNPATLTYTLEETGKYTRITIEMNDFAAQNLYGIYISTTLYEADGSTSFAISGAKDEDSIFGDGEHTIHFVLKEGATPGSAEFWIEKVETNNRDGFFGGPSTFGWSDFPDFTLDTSKKTILNIIDVNVKQETSYCGRANKNEPLFSILSTYDGENLPSFNFTPYFNSWNNVNEIVNLKAYIRKFSTIGNPLRGDKNDGSSGDAEDADAIDLGIFDYRAPLQASNSENYFVGTIKFNPVSGEDLSYTIPENMKSYLAEGDRYYIYT